MHVQFWGAARTVTGSMHLVVVDGRRLLLDCGLFQGRRKEAFERNRKLPFDPRGIDAVVLSHAHIDHSGNLPSLVRGGFDGPIFATPATRDLCAYMLLDSAQIQENDVQYVNRRREARGETPFEPLYTAADAVDTLRRFVTVDYDRPFEPVPGVRTHFVNAGHILGAASVALDLTEGGRSRRLVFSGDIGRKDQPILKDPQIIADADCLIMESTYGDRRHEGTGEAREALRRLVHETCVERHGKLLIPAFAVGRTQEIVYGLNELWEAGRLPPVDVFVDSPLAVNATEVLRLHPECYDEEMRKTILRDDDHDALGFRRLRYIREAAASKALNDIEGPAVIVSASGMCEGGRILHHLKNHLGDPRTTLLFVGFQAESTLGRYILDGNDPIKIFGDPVAVRARIEKVDGYSAHADRDELLEWASRTRDAGRLQRTFLVHGEPPAMYTLAAGLRGVGLQHVEIPERGQVFDL
ncbi:MBL fold metallo-hydrolase [bacterium]|nr:MBL fold metallo-hydrolase [Chloroflexi bacterium CFX6]RIL10026.1 MAG: MBL fold metallo-hydrolase [bacterium]